MGTRSRLIIKRYNKQHIYLWQHWDGYLEGVGFDLCNQMKIILEKYSIKELVELVENINEGTEIFSTDKLINVIEGMVNVEYDKCDDIEYTYVIDCEGEFIAVNWCDDIFVKLPFEMVKKGYTFTDIVQTNV